MKQFKKCSILKETNSHYSNSSDIFRDILPFGEMDRTDGKYAHGEIMPMTEEDKARDRKEIREYMNNNHNLMPNQVSYESTSVFNKENIKAFNWNDIDGKVLKMSVYEGELGISVIGIDETNGYMYVIYNKVNEEELK